MYRKMLCRLIIFSLVAVTFTPFSPLTVNAERPIEVIIDGKKVNFDVQPEIIKDRVLVPFRTIFETIGATVHYDVKTKTVTSTKNGDEIKLTLNSAIGVVNGSQVKMDVAPTIIKDRTLVPLRFIGENFDGQVDWNQQSKQVMITTFDQPENDISVFLNNKKLTFDISPIERNNQVYLPLESLLSQMGDDVEFERDGDTLYIYVDAAIVTAYLGRDYANVNGEYVMVRHLPIEENGMVYVKPKFISDIFGGSTFISPDGQEIRMIINRTNLRSEFLKKEKAFIVMPTNVEQATFHGNRRLMISDNPEVLNRNTVPTLNATLWEDHVETQEVSMDHRVYGWHVNELGRWANLGITIENLSETNEIEVTNIKGIDRSTRSSYDVGLPLSEAALSNKLPTITMQNPKIQANGSAVINAFGVDAGSLIGFLKDFTVKKSSGTGDLSYKIRVVLTQVNDDLSSIKTDPVEIDRMNAHPRGVWKSSEIHTTLPVYEADSPEVAYSISNGKTDNLLSIENALGSGKHTVVKNPGHYGAIYKVSIPLANQTGNVKTVRVRLGARGGGYNGVIKVNGKVYMIPPLQPGTEVANVTDYRMEGKEAKLELEIMHSGGAALPLAIDILTLN